jgi:hypothetical protein
MARRFSELIQGFGAGAAMSMAGITTQLSGRHKRARRKRRRYFLSDEELLAEAAGLESVEEEEESAGFESLLDSDFDSPSLEGLEREDPPDLA